MAFEYKFTEESGELLSRFLECAAPSGCEHEATDLFVDTVTAWCDEVRRDAIGNVTAIINPDAAIRVMVSAHADEVGFQITSVTPAGMLRFRTVGGVDPLSICGHKVRLLSSTGKDTTGVVTRNRALGNMDQNGNAVAKVSEMWIDIGADSRQGALQMVQIGDYGVVISGASQLNGKLLVGRALDNKAGLFVVAEMLRQFAGRKLELGIYAVANVQEEIGLRGMAVAAQAIEPHIALVVDMAHATDIPGGDAAGGGELSLGEGVALTRNADNDPQLVAALKQTAADNGIPYQIIVGNSITGGSDAARVQLFGAGTITANVSIPCRYMHSPTECCDMRDVASAIELLVAHLCTVQ